MMDIREKLVDLLVRCAIEKSITIEPVAESRLVDFLVTHGVTVQEWINSEEMLPEFPCLALYVNGGYVFIPDGILTIKDKHGEWCIDAALAKEVRLIDGTKAETLLWENRIAYWMPLPNLPEDGGANHA